MSSPFSCSVIIVAYNSRDYIPACVASVSDALENIDSEIFVVDNGSFVPILEEQKKAFPNVHWIVSQENLGFGKGCNLAAKQATKEILFFINPDTVVSKGTFQRTLAYMASKADAGAVGCKILNGDGTLQWACRRSFPSPFAAICKTIGLSALFPKSKIFASYNMTYLDPNVETEVDAVSGSFLGVKREIFNQLNGFDEDYFMYGEDLDICLRIKKSGYRNYYYPGTSILHFKGQSSKTRRFRTFVDFYMAMLIFAKKHHNYHMPTFIIALGIFFAALIGVFSRLVPQWWKMLVDVAIVGLCVLLYSLAAPISCKVAGVLALFTWLPLALAGDYVSSKLDGFRLLKFLLPSAAAGSAVSVLLLGTEVSIVAPAIGVVFGCIFWRRLLFWLDYFYQIFSGKAKRSILLGGSTDAIDCWFDRYHLKPGLNLLGCVSNAPEKVTEENREHLLGGLRDLPSICKRTGCKELLVLSDSNGFRESFDQEWVKSLGVCPKLLIGTENNSDYAVVDLNYFY